MSRDDNARFVLTNVLVREGGIADVKDGKGITRFGQTEDWLKEYGLPVPTTKPEAEENYRKWLLMTNLIAVCEVGDELADFVIDAAVHSHARVAIRVLQRSLGVPPDGVLGPQTEAALARAPRRRLAFRFLAERMRFLGRLVTNEPDMNAKFAAGWNNRLADQLESLA